MHVQCHVICDCLWVYCIPPHYLKSSMIFGEKCTEHNVCCDFLYNLWLKHFTFWDDLSEILSWTYIDLQVKYPWFADFTKHEFSWQTSEKYPNVKFHENLSSGSCSSPCRRMVRQADTMKLTVAVHNFSNMPTIDDWQNAFITRFFFFLLLLLFQMCCKAATKLPAAYPTIIILWK